MKFSFSYIFLLSGLFIFSCKKNDADLKKNYKIELTAGDGQTDITGTTLQTQLAFKITIIGHIAPVPTPNAGSVVFETINCDNEPETEQTPVSSGISNAGYNWRLNETVGKQYLKAILLDSFGVRRDSVTATATGIAPTQGWYRSGCIPSNTFCQTLCKLPAGRILAGLRRSDYPYYSDDEGRTWHKLTTMPAKYPIYKLISTPLNEVFLSVANVGMFYSNNGGQNWELRNNGLPDLSKFGGDINYTRSGKLLTLTLDGMFVSENKGLTWQNAMQGLSYYTSFFDAYSTSDGTIYAIHGGELYKSITGGQSWTEVFTLSSTVGLSFLFVDENDDIYVGIATGIGMSYGVYVSKNNAQTWTKIYTPTPAPNYDFKTSLMTKQNGAYYFYSTSENLLIRTTDFITYIPVNPPVGSNNGRRSWRYIVTNNNNPVLATEWYGLYYYKP